MTSMLDSRVDLRENDLIFVHDTLALRTSRNGLSNLETTPICRWRHLYVPNDRSPQNLFVGLEVFGQASPFSRSSLQDLSSPGGDTDHNRLMDRSPWSGIRSDVSAWRLLEDDWDGEFGVKPTADQLAAASAFITAAEFANVREPRSYLAPDGEIGFHWDGRRKASVSFLPEARFLAYIPRDEREAVRIAGPLDLAASSKSMFDALSNMQSE